MHKTSNSSRSRWFYGVFIISIIVLIVFGLLAVELRWYLSSSRDQSSSSTTHQNKESSSITKLLDERQHLLAENDQLKLKISQLLVRHRDDQETTQAQEENKNTHRLHDVKKLSEQHQDNNHHNQPWLIIGIPTVPRHLTPGEPNRPVLLRTLDSLKKQVARPSFVKDNHFLVKIVVMNQRPGAHPAFDQAKREFTSNNKKDEVINNWIEFHENTNPYHDPPYAEAGQIDQEFVNKHQEAPTPRVKGQTLDVASLLKVVEGRSQYFLFYEDDFHFCDNALLHLMNMVERVNLMNEHKYGQLNSWSAIRCSFGLAGIVMQNGKQQEKHGDQSESNDDDERLPSQMSNGLQRVPSADTLHPDVSTLRKYFLRHYNRRPPDHLVVEFYAKESSFSKKYFGKSRNVAAYRYNILRHDGVKSTLREDDGWSMPGCFEELVVPQVFEVEAWNARECPNSDLWPCDFEDGKKQVSGDKRREGMGFRSFVKNAKIEKREA